MEVTFETDNDALTHESNQPAAPIPSRVDVDPHGGSPCCGRLLRTRVSTAPGVAFNRGPFCSEPALGGGTTRPGTLFGRRSATGVGAAGVTVGEVDLGWVVAGTPKEKPQLPQKRACGSFSAPQLGQPAASGLPHSRQNFRSGRFSVPHLEQITRAA